MHRCEQNEQPRYREKQLRSGMPTTVLLASRARRLHLRRGLVARVVKVVPHETFALVDLTIVLSECTGGHGLGREGGIRWNDPDIAFPWPFKEAVIITSDKDRRLPFLKEFASPFAYDGHPLAPLTVSDV